MPKVPPKKQKLQRSEEAVEATLSVRLNSTGAMVDYECGNPECTEKIGETEEYDFDKAGKLTVAASKEEAICGAEGCGKANFNEGFTISKL